MFILVRDSHFGQFMDTLNPGQFSKKKDFLNCHIRKKIIKDLQDNGETKFDGECLSDFVFLYDKKLKKKRMCLLITAQNIYIYDHRNWKLIFTNELNNLTAMSIAARNCTLMSIHFATGSDLMLESYRRIDLILYCARNMKEMNLPLFKLKIRKNFRQANSPDKGKGGKTEDSDAPLKDVPLKDVEKASKYMDTGFLQETIRNSRKAGFMRLHKKGLFGHSFTEYFFILSDLGLIYFKNYGEKKASGFVPLLGGSIKTYAKSVFGKENIFAIRFANEEVVLQAASKVEEEEWSKIIKEMQDKGLTAKDTIKEIGKVL
jgi:PH domain/Unconventional myosin tail, actin- and lipid-binding